MAETPKATGSEPAKPSVPSLLKDKNADDDLKPKRLVPKSPPVPSRSIAVGMIVAAGLISTAWIVNTRFGERYQLVPVQAHENTFMYRIDTFSGAVHFCTAQQCTELPER